MVGLTRCSSPIPHFAVLSRRSTMSILSLGNAGEVWALHYAAIIVLSNAFRLLSSPVSVI